MQRLEDELTSVVNISELVASSLLLPDIGYSLAVALNVQCRQIATVCTAWKAAVKSLRQDSEFAGTRAFYCHPNPPNLPAHPAHPAHTAHFTLLDLAESEAAARKEYALAKENEKV